MKDKESYYSKPKQWYSALFVVGLLTILLGMVLSNSVVAIWGIIILILCVGLQQSRKNSIYYKDIVKSTQITAEEYDQYVKSKSKR